MEVVEKLLVGALAIFIAYEVSDLSGGKKKGSGSGGKVPVVDEGKGPGDGHGIVGSESWGDMNAEHHEAGIYYPPGVTPEEAATNRRGRGF